MNRPERHAAPFQPGHCAYCDKLFSMAQFRRPGLVRRLIPCASRGDFVRTFELVQLGVSPMATYVRCGKGLGTPSGVVRICFCNTACPSYTPDVEEERHS